ncbi:hypothetical protein VST7929_00778 [Vibrio stylophorae]|uniref:Transporter n=1 Tax=Vibrio stylophorae TaxID=659351 RepID=A0ABN8DNZ9_9VIBR|nr:ComEA family DNA-binding protein [Vibrio stylophorae]CAH0532929.1 hypothetical protein VST7929_00778 [Vibrio stylophorae]
MKLLLSCLSLMAALWLLPVQAESTDNQVQAEEAFAIQVNINTATAEELETLLTGIGETKAKRIVEYRQANGDFQSVDDLVKVKGIGVATVNKNRDKLTY